MRFDDDYGTLGSYFAEFSENPVSGLAATRSGDSFFTTEQVSGGSKAVRMERSLVRDIQQQLNLMQAGAGTSQMWDAKTEAAWKLYTKTFREPFSDFAVDETGGANSLKDYKRVWLHPEAASRLRVRARAAYGAAPTPTPTPAAKPATTATKPATPPAPVAPELKTVVQSTFEVQSVLKRLGFPADRLSDGKFGATTKARWEEAAKTRSLVPTISAKGADIKNVIVNERTYLMLKADADAKVAPAPTTVDEEVYVDSNQMEDVIARLVGIPVGEKPTPEQVQGYWTQYTTAGGLSRDIHHQLHSTGLLQPGQTKCVRCQAGYYVKQSAWTAMQAAAAQKPARPQPAPGPKTDQLKLDTDALIKASTSVMSVADLRTAFRAAFALTKDGVFDIPATGSWDHTLVTPLLKGLSVPESKFPLWQNALGPGPGKLVEADLKSIKLLPAAADSLKKLVDSYKKAAADDAALYKGYTKVNSADVISNINALGVSTKVFNKSGDYKELADALRTFADNTKVSLPGGDIVKVDSKKNVYVKDEALVAVAKKAMEIKAAADATKKFRDAMVANAVKDSTQAVKVLDMQKAWKDVVLAQAAGKATQKVEARLVDVLKKVQLTGSFDAATREAYTAVALPLIIGPAVLEFEKLLKQQLGPNFKVSLVEDVRNQVWNDYLARVVVKDKISTLPAIAKIVQVGAVNYDKNISADRQRAEIAEAHAKTLREAVAKATAIVSVLDLQLALLQGAGKGIKATGVKLTGFADKATNDGLFQFAGLIFPAGYVVPDTSWQSFLKQTGWVVVSDKEAARGWGGTTNYISLPPALADKVATLAGEYIAAKGRPQVQVVKFNNPHLVLAKVPQKKTPPPEKHDFAKEEEDARKKREAALKKQQAEEKAALEAKRKADEAARAAEAAKQAGDLEAARKATAEAQRQLEEARRLAAEAAKAAEEARAAAAAQQQTAPIVEPPPVIAPGPTAQDTAAAGGAAAGGAGGGAQVTGPTINITTPGPVEPVQAGMGMGMGTLIGGGAVALLALLVSKSADNTGSEKRSRMNR